MTVFNLIYFLCYSSDAIATDRHFEALVRELKAGGPIPKLESLRDRLTEALDASRPEPTRSDLP